MDVREVAAHIAAGGPVRVTGGAYMVKCPAHEDGTASLSIGVGTTQPVVLFCHAGCDPADILTAANLTWDQVSAPLDKTAPAHRGTQTVYSYRDADGTERYQVVRSVGSDGHKKFLQRRMVDGSWVWNLQGVERLIYRLPEVIAAVAAGEPVWITEGEKDADALVDQGVCATCNSGGAGKWREEFASAFEGAEVTVVADADTPGREHARTVWESVTKAGATARIVEAAHGKDAYDHRAGGGTLETFKVTKPFSPVRKPSVGMDIDVYLAQTLPPQKFVLPGTLAESEVWMVTAFEGHGKSKLLKQIAVQSALGYHPWMGTKCQPRNVLIIDTENATRDNFDDLIQLRNIAQNYGNWANRGKLVIEEPGPIDLLSNAWQQWLFERVQAVQPDLVVCGPIYRMVGKELREENVARVFMETITAMQQINNCAVILEHHVPKANMGERGLDPLGSGLFLRWCNFITGLRPLEFDGKETGVYSLDHQRKGRVRSRQWPTHLRWGRGLEWPWEPTTEAEVELMVTQR